MLRPGLALAALTGTLAFASGPPPDPPPEPPGRQRPGELLVRLAPDIPYPSLTHLPFVTSDLAPLFHRLRTDSAARDTLARWRHVAILEDVDPRDAARQLEALHWIEVAEPVREVELAAIPDDPFAGGSGGGWSSGSWGQAYADLWGLETIGADAAWDVETGDPSVVVAIVDSGLDYNHPDIAGNVWSNPGEIAGNGIDDDGNGYVDDVRGWDFAYGSADVFDWHWHGTHMAGIVAARGNNAEGIAGVMWNASVMPVKSFDNGGAGTIPWMADGIVYATDNGADVINMSFSFRGSGSELLRDAVRYAYDAGVVLVAAAGNSGSDIGDCNLGFPLQAPVSIPSCYRETIAVGGVDHFDVLSNDSNRGAAIDVVAPGGDNSDETNNKAYKNILSLLTSGSTLERDQTHGAYYRNRGTSMAAAYVSGLAGLALSHRPQLTSERLRAVLQAAAVDLGAPGHDALHGFGRIDAAATLSEAQRSAGLPELVPWALASDRYTAAPGAPLTLELRVRNVGEGIAAASTARLYDGATPVASWQLPPLASGAEHAIEHVASFEQRGPHTLRLVVDDDGQVAEFFEGNNERSTTVEVYGYRFVERRLTTAIGVQENAAVSGSRVVWQDYRLTPASSDIWMFDLDSGVESQLTFSTYYEEYPAIDGDTVVWADLRPSDPPPGTWDIERKDLSSGARTAITDETTAEFSVDVDGDWIVWFDSRNGLGNSDIYGYEMSTDDEVQLTSAPGNQEAPSVDGDLVAYEDFRHGQAEIYLFDRSTGVETRITNDPDWQLLPAVSGNRLVYEDKRHGNWEIYLHDLGDDSQRRLTTAPGDQFNPEFDGDFVVWQDDRGGDDDIWLHDLALDEARRVTLDFAVQRRPDVDGRTIVWSDFRHADPAFGWSFEIYAATIDDFPAPPLGLSAVPQTNGIRLSWQGNLEPENDLQDYAVYRSYEDGPWTRVAVTADTVFDDTTATAGGLYAYRVTARDQGLGNTDLQAGESPFSVTVHASGSGPPPVGPGPPRPAFEPPLTNGTSTIRNGGSPR